MRVRLDYNDTPGNLSGNRFYISYAGAAPTAANCATIATDIATAWNTNLASLVSSSFSLAEVDVLDIATLTGLSGNWTGSHNGTDGSQFIPANVATNIEFNIARRYRGGKPRIFLPPPGSDALQSVGFWTQNFIDEAQTGISAFFAAIAALSVGAVGVLAHVNLSYYTGFKNITNSSGRERAVPQYRDSALLDPITAYTVKNVVGSQRRRRKATSY
jgi:uncharacterized protein (UPF0333 family)